MPRPRRTQLVVVSDRAAAGTRPDGTAGPLAARLAELGLEHVGTELVPDGVEPLAALLARLADGGAADLVLTVGGSGLSPRDLSPEATAAIAERDVPGLMEHARRECSSITPLAALSRGRAATRRRTLIVNLPGHPRAALEVLDALAPLLPHALDTLAQAPTDCEHTGRGGEA